MSSIRNWFHKIKANERRTSKRQEVSELVAYYWDGGTPVPHKVRNITTEGVYLLTEQRWYPGTVVTLTMQKTGGSESDPDRSIAVKAKVAHFGTDGVGLSFILQVTPKHGREHHTLGDDTDKKTLQKFLHSLQSDSGESLMEFALLSAFPLLILTFAIKAYTSLWPSAQLASEHEVHLSHALMEVTVPSGINIERIQGSQNENFE